MKSLSDRARVESALDEIAKAQKSEITQIQKSILAAEKKAAEDLQIRRQEFFKEEYSRVKHIRGPERNRIIIQGKMFVQIHNQSSAEAICEWMFVNILDSLAKGEFHSVEQCLLAFFADEHAWSYATNSKLSNGRYLFEMLISHTPKDPDFCRLFFRYAQVAFDRKDLGFDATQILVSRHGSGLLALRKTEEGREFLKRCPKLADGVQYQSEQPGWYVALVILQAFYKRNSCLCRNGNAL